MFEPHRAQEILAKYSYSVYIWSRRKLSEKPREKQLEIPA